MKKKPDASPEKPRKGIAETARELEEKQAQLLAQQQEELHRQEEAAREAYADQIRQERVELMQLRQGVIGESETFREEQPEEKHYTIWQKISNFFYHNSWWLGIAGLLVGITVFLTVHTLMRVQPDMIILLASDDDSFYALCGDRIADVFEQYISDENGDGKVKAEVYYVPISGKNEQTTGLSGDHEKFYTELMAGEAVLMISDKDADAFFSPEDTLVDLEPAFGSYQETEGVRFMLSDTAFGKDIDWVEPVDDDIYIGIRAVRKTSLDSEERMQKTYDIAYPALQAFIQEYGTTEAAE